MKRTRDRSTGGVRRGQGGFNTLELLLTVALAGILVAVTVPAATKSLRTYNRNGAARQALADIRRAQSMAVARGDVFAWQWGSDTGVSLPADQYRIARDTSGSCGFPSVGTPEDGINVIDSWRQLSVEYGGMTIQSIRDSTNKSLGVVMFNALGTSVNTCTSVSFPVTVTLADSDGKTRRIEIRSAGSTRLL